jgi:hypothetical protein
MIAFWCAPEPIKIHIDVGSQSIMNPLVHCPDQNDPVPTVSDNSPLWGALSGGNAFAHANLLAPFGSQPATRAANFSPVRADVFRYAVFGHFIHPGEDGPGGTANGELPGDEFIAAVAGRSYPLGPAQITRWEMEGDVFMHELGHNLGLAHGGIPGQPNYKPNYLSIMNYNFDGLGLFINNTRGHLDYSRFDSSDVVTLNELDLDEGPGLGGNPAIDAYGTMWWCENDGGIPAQLDAGTFGAAVARRADGVLDFNCNGSEDGVINPLGTCVDIQDNGGADGRDQDDVNDCQVGDVDVQADVTSGPQEAPGYTSALTSHDDWSSLIFASGDIGPSSSVASMSPRADAHLYADITAEEQIARDAAFPDGDGDLLLDSAEPDHGTSQSDADSDDDGAEDGWEVGTLTTGPVDPDSDGDGCEDGEELTWQQEAGGRRNPASFWDFFDTPDGLNVRDRAVAGTDFFRLLARFGATGSPALDPLSAPPAAPAYHTAFDRASAPPGTDAWDLSAADGAITGQDFFFVLGQFGHDCS